MSKSLNKNYIAPVFYNNNIKIYDSKVDLVSSRLITDNTFSFYTCDISGSINKIDLSNLNFKNEEKPFFSLSRSIKVSKEGLRSLDISHSNNKTHLVTGGESGKVLLYDINNFDKPVFNTKIKDSEITKVKFYNMNSSAFSNNSNNITNDSTQFILTATNKGNVYLLDTRTNKANVLFSSSFKTNKAKPKLFEKLQFDQITDIQYSMNNQNSNSSSYLVFCSNTNGSVLCYDIRKNLELIDLSDSFDDSINCLEIYRNKVLCGLAESGIGVLNINNLGKIEDKIPTKFGVTSIFNLDSLDYTTNHYNESFDDKFNGKLMYGSEDGVVRLFNFEDKNIDKFIIDDKNMKLENKAFGDITGINIFGNHAISNDDVNIDKDDKDENDLNKLYMSLVSNVGHLKFYDISKIFDKKSADSRKEKDEDMMDESNVNKKEKEDKESSNNEKEDEDIEDDEDMEEDDEDMEEDDEDIEEGEEIDDDIQEDDDIEDLGDIDDNEKEDNEESDNNEDKDENEDSNELESDSDSVNSVFANIKDDEEEINNIESNNKNKIKSLYNNKKKDDNNKAPIVSKKKNEEEDDSNNEEEEMNNEDEEEEDSDDSMSMSSESSEKNTKKKGKKIKDKLINSAKLINLDKRKEFFSNL